MIVSLWYMCQIVPVVLDGTAYDRGPALLNYITMGEGRWFGVADGPDAMMVGFTWDQDYLLATTITQEVNDLVQAPDAEVFDIRAGLRESSTSWGRRSAFVTAAAGRGIYVVGGSTVGHFVRDAVKINLLKTRLGIAPGEGAVSRSMIEGLRTRTHFGLSSGRARFGHPRCHLGK